MRSRRQAILGCFHGTLSERQDCKQGTEGNNKSADPDPYNERSNQHFQCGLILIQLAEAGKDQIKIFADRAPVYRAPHRRLLVWKELQGGG